MSDDSFIREVDEELRHDQAKQFWDRYRTWIIAGAMSIVLATAGFRGWEYYTNSIAAKSGDQFMQAISLSNEGKHSEAISSLEELIIEGSGQYPALAKLRIASELALSGEVGSSIEKYDQIASDNSFDQSFRLIAQLRAGLLAVDVNDLDDVNRRLQPMAAAGLPFRHSAREGLGLANFKAGNLSEAFKWFSAILNDAEAGAGVRSRANVMRDVLLGKGVSQQKAAS